MANDLHRPLVTLDNLEIVILNKKRILRGKSDTINNEINVLRNCSNGKIPLIVWYNLYHGWSKIDRPDYGLIIDLAVWENLGNKILNRKKKDKTSKHCRTVRIL